MKPIAAPEDGRTPAWLRPPCHRWQLWSSGYDRKSADGRLDKALDEALAKGWVVVSMKDDWKITQAESKQIRARWEELKTVTEGFVACCEQVNFGPLKNAAAKRAPEKQG